MKRGSGMATVPETRGARSDGTPSPHAVALASGSVIVPLPWIMPAWRGWDKHLSRSGPSSQHHPSVAILLRGVGQLLPQPAATFDDGAVVATPGRVGQIVQ